MRQFNTLTGAIQSKSSNPAIGESISVTGYDNIFDGGKGDWVFEGVTGQTPSQSPLQLGDGLFNDASGNQRKLVTGGSLNPLSIGFSTGATDNSAAFSALKVVTLGGDYHTSVIWPAGDFKFTQPITINPTDTPNLTTSIRNVTWKGAGGSALDTATRLFFDVPAGTADMFTLSAVYQANFKNIAFRSTNNCGSIVKVTAGDSPEFSFHLVKFDGVTFQLGGSATVSDASLVTENGKLLKLDTCYFPGGSTNEFKAIRAGGNATDNASTLQQGVMHNLNLDNCFVFGDLDIRNCKQWRVEGSVFDEGGRIYSTGDQRMQSGYLGATAFLEDSIHPAFTQGNYTNAGVSGEEAGWVTIENCEFRDRKESVRVTVGNINITNNEHYVRRTGDKGVVIEATAENVKIDSLNNFRLAFRNSNIAIDDQRYSATPDANIDKDLFVSEFLESNVTLNNFGNFETVVQKTTIGTRGGNYKISWASSILNGGTAQRFRLRIQHRLSDGTITTIPCQQSFSIGANETEAISGYIVCKLPADVTDASGTSNLTLSVQADATNGATVRGRASGTLGITYLQAEECS